MARKRIDVEHFGPVAVVAGAAEGLGAAFARELADAGFELVLIDVREAQVLALCSELETKHGRRARAVIADLGSAGVRHTVLAMTRDLDVGLLVYNAAMAPVGPFASSKLEELERAIDVNNRGVLELLGAFLPAMIEKGRGGILLMGSNAGLIGHPLTAVYGATKAFLARLGEALNEELSASGIRLVVACPGAIATPGFFRSGAHVSRWLTATPQETAVEALDCLTGKAPVVSLGRMNRKVIGILSRLPTRMAVALMGKVMRRVYG